MLVGGAARVGCKYVTLAPLHTFISRCSCSLKIKEILKAGNTASEMTQKSQAENGLTAPVGYATV